MVMRLILFIVFLCHLSNSLWLRPWKTRLGCASHVIEESYSQAIDTFSFSVPLLQSLLLENWGAFANATLSFPSHPALTVITGETGTGKSMLLKSIAYGVGMTNNRLIKDEIKDDMLVFLAFNYNQSISTAKRIFRYDSKGKGKSECEFNNNMKTKVKDLEANLAPLVRFWSAESLSNLDNDYFMSYMDESLPNQDILDEVQYTYAMWLKEHKELQDLIDLQKKAEESNLLEEIKLELKVFEDLDYAVENVIEQMDTFFLIDEPALNRNSASNAISSDNLTDKNPMESLLQSESLSWNDFQLLIRYYYDSKGSKKGGKSTTQWQIAFHLLQTAKDFLKTYHKLMEAQLNKYIEVDNRAVGLLKGKTSQSQPLKEVQRNTDLLDNDIKQFETKLKSISLYDLLPAEIFAELRQATTIIRESLDQVQSLYESLSSVLPNQPSLVIDIQAVEKQWNALASKHSTSSDRIHLVYDRLVEKYNRVINFNDEFPLQQEKELMWRNKYIAAAHKLSYCRLQHVDRVVREINHCLPQLDMQDKCIYVNFESAIANELSQHYFLNNSVPNTKLLNAAGYDSFFFSSKGWEHLGITLSKPSIHMADDRQYIHFLRRVYSGISAEHTTKPAFTDADEGNQACFDRANNVFDVLSSGEQARLALALELSLSERSNILIFDEIDNHVGGESVVKLAELLFQYSRKRQIIAVTHNVNIALKADKHILVRKVQESRSTVRQSEKNAMPISSVQELSTQEERNEEVMRMLGGAKNIKNILNIIYNH